MLVLGTMMPVSLRAQRIFSQGLILYDVKVEEPVNAHSKQDDPFSGSKMELMVTDKMTRMDLLLGTGDRVVYSNIADTTAVALINRGPDKYLIRMSKSEVEKELENYKDMDFQDAHASRQIAGFNCHKAVGKTRDGNTITVYYATDLVPESPAYFPDFPRLKGVPLQFETKSGGLKMTMTATQVDLSPLPVSQFDIPTSGYKEITQTEIQDMTND